MSGSRGGAVWRAVCWGWGGHPAGCAPPSCSCHLLHHICNWQTRGVELDRYSFRGLVSLLGTCTYKQACVRTGGGMWPVYTVPGLTPPPPRCYLWTARTGSLMRAESALLKRRRLRGSAGYCKSPFIAFPRDFLLCTPTRSEERR